MVNINKLNNLKLKKRNKTSIENDLKDAQIEILQQHSNTDLITAMQILASNENLESNTVLTNEQVNGLTMANWAGQVYGFDFLNYYVALFPKYRISGDNGLGRKQLIQIAEAIQKNKMEQDNRLMELLGRR